jgi:hypothetical protein
VVRTATRPLGARQGVPQVPTGVPHLPQYVYTSPPPHTAPPSSCKVRTESSNNVPLRVYAMLHRYVHIPQHPFSSSSGAIISYQGANTQTVQSVSGCRIYLILTPSLPSPSSRFPRFQLFPPKNFLAKVKSRHTHTHTHTDLWACSHHTRRTHHIVPITLSLTIDCK